MNTPNEMRKMIGHMRGKPVVKENNNQDAPKKEMTVRDMLKITRTLNETEDKKTSYDQSQEEELSSIQEEEPGGFRVQEQETAGERSRNRVREDPLSWTSGVQERSREQ